MSSPQPWLCAGDPEDEQHVIPINDLIAHRLTDDCVCGPTTEAVKRDDGSVGWVITHHSLDGRENHENEPEASRSDRWARWTPLINVLFALTFAWLYGAIWHPSYEVTRWIILAVSTAYLAAMVASYIHTRRNK